MTEQRQKYIVKSHYKQQLRKVIIDIQDNRLEKYDKIPLKGFKGYRRIRVGDIRIVYQELSNGTRRIAYIGPRGDIYDML